MVRIATGSLALLGLARHASATGCPFGADTQANILGRQAQASDNLEEFMVDDSTGYMSSDVGGPITEQESLKVGARGPSLLEDFIFRQKIQHFDHERVPERAVHARGVGAHGTFTSYADWSNLTAASFLSEKGKETPMYVRFSTVAGSRGSADTARDVHGFATRFYTDEGNFDIVGNNMPVFFIQDAIQFPDLIHAVKPSPDNEIPQAATAHDSAWDFFSQQPSSLHTLFWAMAGNGIPRSFRHVDGFGIHTFRFVTDDGTSKLIKFHWKSKQGRASLVWEEAQIVAGKNPDFHRQDLWDAIESGNFPEWELNVQIIDEDMVEAYGFDLLDPTKILPEELVPLTPIGVMQLNQNPTNYFAETEQVMFQVGHLVRGVDFSDDPLLQGRIFSYLDTQLNRHNGPNFEQLPINRPKAVIHNNNRDGGGQNFIHKNVAHYSPNTLNKGYPKQATQNTGKGFFSSPSRSYSGKLVRGRSPSFDDNWSQTRLFYNSLQPVEQQWLINAIRFETSKLESTTVKENVLTQLNLVSNDIAKRVATALGMDAPAPNSTYYHNNVTTGISITNYTLPTIATLNVGILATTKDLGTAQQLYSQLTADNLTVTIVAESLASGVNKTYSAADATDFDAVIATSDAEAAGLFKHNTTSTLYPANRPAQIFENAYLFGKPVAYAGNGTLPGLVTAGEGVYTGSSVASIVSDIETGLKTFKFTSRFAMDS